MPSSPQKDLAAFKRVYRKTNNIRESALAAGYSQSVANKGITDMPAETKRFVLRHNRRLSKLAALGSAVDAQQQEAIVRGGILANIAEGKDRAVNSLKLGGQDRRINMFGGDAGGAVILIQPPTGLLERLAQSLQPVIEGEVIESK